MTEHKPLNYGSAQETIEAHVSAFGPTGIPGLAAELKEQWDREPRDVGVTTYKEVVTLVITIIIRKNPQFCLEWCGELGIVLDLDWAFELAEAAKETTSD